MSKSRKKHPIYKQHFKGAKRSASRAFRRFKGDIPASSRQFYRKVYEPWNVSDNWVYDWDCEKNKTEYRLILKKLYNNGIDWLLSEEEVEELLEKLKDLRYSYLWTKK